jgi:iron(III)-enterobactin esterase
MNRIARPFFVCFAALLVAGFGGAGVTQEKHDTTGNGDFIVGPDYEIDPDLKDKGNLKGQSFEVSMTLADSKIFPGNESTLDPKKAVRKQRKVFVYVPCTLRTA